ncbi:PLDc_N domain-containing protein [Algoriphagus lutimaris]|uniref:PLD nuclease N-terminal domain-containing protein n=1 Tax=Algoriphagus lutimaris TaxID=613197 RepID=UPI00196B0E57|nr:PLDc_N domain-containing protein [Algoriphagus lutimaris]
MDLIVPSNGLLFWLLGSLLFLVSYFGFTIYALKDMIRSDFRDHQMKLIWVMVILILPILGKFLYISMNRKTKGILETLNLIFQNPRINT